MYQVKIIDFGSACFSRGDDLTTWAGTLFYASPECSHNSYGRAADVWAVGVVMWVLLHGPPPVSEMLQVYNMTHNALRSHSRASLRQPRSHRNSARLSSTHHPTGRIFRREATTHHPFQAGRCAQHYRKLQLGETGDGLPTGLSADCKDLLHRLLQPDVYKRLTAAQALGHPWLGGTSGQVPRSPCALPSGRGSDAPSSRQQYEDATIAVLQAELSSKVRLCARVWREQRRANVTDSTPSTASGATRRRSAICIIAF